MRLELEAVPAGRRAKHEQAKPAIIEVLKSADRKKA